MRDTRHNGREVRAARIMPYLRKSVPREFQDDLPEWTRSQSPQGVQIKRCWWPRFVCRVDATNTRMFDVRWLDDPGDQRQQTLARCTEAFGITFQDDVVDRRRQPMTAAGTGMQRNAKV
jgi:hypothetical protein